MDLPWLFSLGLRREDPEQRNNKINAKVRLEVAVWLAASRGANGLRRQRRKWRVGTVRERRGQGSRSQDIVSRIGRRRRTRRSRHWVRMRRDLIDRKGHLLNSSCLG